jgi:hypothetical protein
MQRGAPNECFNYLNTGRACCSLPFCAIRTDMGETYLIVNPAERQYLDISQFNANNKVSGLMRHRHALAVLTLVCNFEAVRHGDFALKNADFRTTSKARIIATDSDVSEQLKT